MDDDKTIIIYSGDSDEGGTLAGSAIFAEPTATSTSLTDDKTHYELPFLENDQGQPFLSALRAMYGKVYALETGSESITSISQLHSELIDIMDRHTHMMSDQGYENTHIMIVRYIISTFIDERLGLLDWPDGDSWANHSLLSYYYHETYGGEKFFQLLSQFINEPVKYLQHMKLAYACLALGYQGKYSLSDYPSNHLDAIRQELFRRIESVDDEKEKFYSGHPPAVRKNKLTLHVPYGMLLLGGLILLGVVYTIFTSMVSQREESLVNMLHSGPKTIQLDPKDSHGRK